MATKHIDINARGSDGRWSFQKVYFPDDTFTAASGNTYKLGRYRNKGGNGTLFECYGRDKKIYAVKFLHQLDEQRRARFDFESLVLADLDHPNVLKGFDVGSVETTHHQPVPFLVAELFTGHLQFSVEQAGRLDPSLVKKYAIDIASGLGYIHKQGVIHRDLKPANVFLSSTHGAVIGDFGIAKTATDAGAERFYRTDLTMVSEFVGPVLWLSPELAAYARDKTQIIDHRSDLFQLGLIIWYLLTGAIPRGGLDIEDDPTKGILFPVVQKLTKQIPERRYSSAQEVLNDLAKMKL